jgi:hypothetical protein
MMSDLQIFIYGAVVVAIMMYGLYLDIRLKK